MKSYRAPLQPCGLIARYCSSLNPLLFLAGSLLLANVAFAQAKALETTFLWITGEPLVYKNWHPNQPDNTADNDKTEYYGEFYAHVRGEWNDESNTVSRRGLYERNTSPPKDSILKWFHWPKSGGGNDHWYAVNETSAVWTTHRELAESMNAYLATTTTAAENTFVQEQTTRGQNGLWFGLHRSDAPIGKKKTPIGPPQGGYERTNITGRVAGFHQISATAPTRSAPQQVQGTATRMSLRMR